MNTTIKLQLGLLAFTGLIAFGIIIFAVSSLVKPSQKDKTPTRAATSLPSPTPHQATPQAFDTSRSLPGTGTLTVTSPLSDVIVTIDAPIHAEAPAAVTPSQRPQVPPQYTPFYLKNIPAGEHTIIAAKPGYIAKTMKIMIEDGKETKITVELSPAR